MDFQVMPLDLDEFQRKKHFQTIEAVRKIYSSASEYTARYANIREKVRAIKLFEQKLGGSESLPLTPALEKVFQEWFLFDYKTIQAETMFSLYLKKNASNLKEAEMVQGALLLSSYYEPAEICSIDCQTNTIDFQLSMNGKKYSAFVEESEFPSLKIGECVYLRRLPVIKKDYILGPVFRSNGKEEIEILIGRYEREKKTTPNLTWRVFLKRDGLLFIAAAS